MIRAENVALWMILGVAMIELLKNLHLEPLLPGSTTKLHPLAVLFAVLGGDILFGVVGLLLALPTVTISKAMVSSAPISSRPMG
jgi:predicted PurR-regulated permease PerM